MRNTRGRRSPAKPTVARPEGPRALDLKNLSEWHPEAVDYAIIAAETALEDRVALFNDLDRVPIDADMIVSGFVEHVAKTDSNLAWKTMLNVVRDIVIADPRYHGVTDTLSQQSCIECRKPKPIEDFDQGHLRCRECEARSANV